MARRSEPDPLAEKVGARIRALREATGLTLEQLAYSCDFSKGQLSTIERGLAVPTASTLNTLAEGLGVLPLDLLTFPDDGPRERLVNLTRYLSKTEMEAVLALLRHRAPQSA
ncbi:MAG: helix-turn-helix transcriptional regulator [Ottowia sp.]|uniref:helix-turn-helix domain-containing protein n=1 Tax=Ottowia sp. TaxID=1898956 RepID=UPI0039E59C9F